MPTLPERLRDFSAAVFDESPGERPPGLEVYRRNLRANFAKVLALEFPAVEQLVGSERFSALARAYQQQHPSRSGNLHGIGAEFVDFLRAALAAEDLGWIAAVAALEWAWEDSAVAADADGVIDAAALAALAPDAQLALRFVVHPALRVVRASVPVLSLWRSHTPDAQGVVAAAAADYRPGPLDVAEAAVIDRPRWQAEVQGVTQGEAAWLEAIGAGAELGDALDAAFAASDDFDLQAALAAALARRRFVALR
jgi:hypothetical protein